MFTTCSAIFSRRRDLFTTWEARNHLAHACALFLVMTLRVSSCSSLCFPKVANKKINARSEKKIKESYCEHVKQLPVTYRKLNRITRKVKFVGISIFNIFFFIFLCTILPMLIDRIQKLNQIYTFV